MNPRRTGTFLCLGVLIFAALLPGAVVFIPSVPDDGAALIHTTGAGYAVAVDVISLPLLDRVTPRHLARASLPSFAA